MNNIPEINSPGQSNTIHDVLIAGAGPVGLFLACELALSGCSVQVLEKTEDPQSPLKQLPFGIRGLSAPTIEALYRRGLLKELELYKHLKNPHKTQSAVQGERRQVGHFAGIPFYEDNIDATQWKYRLPGSTETSLISEMRELETILVRRAETLGVTIMRGIALTGFQQAEDGVTVYSDGRSFQGRWLVGCDGSRSIVRKAGGFEFAGTEPEFTGYSAQVDIVDPEQLNMGRNLTSTGMYLQSQPGFLLIQDFDSGAFHRSGKPVTREHVQEVLRYVSGTSVTIRALHMATTWTDRARQATAYRNGQVFLAGDAAHIHSPLGGQGLNLGIGDVMNLGWKLAATIREKAPEGLLDSYYTERHPIGAAVLDWSRAQVAVMKPAPAVRALYAIIRDLMDTCDGATYMAGRVWGIATHYETCGNYPLAGYSVPNFMLGKGTYLGELMKDGLGILLDFAGNPFLKAFTEQYGGQVKYVTGDAKEQSDLSAILVRPDGIIAWSAGRLPDYSGLHEAAGRWFLKAVVK